MVGHWRVNVDGAAERFGKRFQAVPLERVVVFAIDLPHAIVAALDVVPRDARIGLD